MVDLIGIFNRNTMRGRVTGRQGSQGGDLGVPRLRDLKATNDVLVQASWFSSGPGGGTR